MELNFGYVANYTICIVWAKVCTKLLCRSFYNELLCIYAISVLLIFVAKCKLIFVLNLWLCSCYA
jgi:hypothetical protein